MPQTSASIRRIIEQNEEFLVSLHGHDGYFKVPDSALAAELRAQIKSALESQQTVTLHYDAALNITSIV